MSGNPYTAIENQRAPQPASDDNPYEPKQTSWWKDLLSTIPSSLVRGAANVAGMGADLPHAAGALADYATSKSRAATDYVASRIKGRPHTWEQSQATGADYVKAHPSPGAAITPAGAVANILGVPDSVSRFANPSGQNVTDAVNATLRATTGRAMRRPQTRPGRIADAVLQGVPAAALMGPEGLVKNLVSNAPGVVGSGLAQGATHEFVDPSSPYAAPLEMGAGVLGGIAAPTASALLHPKVPQLAERIAGQATREAHSDSAAAATALAAHTTAPPPVMAGTAPTTAQVLGTPEAQAFERSVENAGKQVPTVNTGAASNLRGNTRAILESGKPAGAGAPVIPNLVGGGIPARDTSIVGGGIQKPDMPAAFGLDPSIGNTQADASARLSATVRQTEQAMKQGEMDAWNRLDKNATMNGAPILAEANRYADTLPLPSRQRFQKAVGSTLRAMTDEYGIVNPELQLEAPPMPVGQLQDFRRIVGEDANRAYMAGKDTEGRNLRGFADVLGKGLGNFDNYNPGSEGAAQDWSDAVAATRRYKENFGSGIGRDLVSTDANGNLMVAPEAAMGRVLQGGSNSVKNVRELRAIEGINTDDVDKAIADWHLGKLSGNGSNFDVPASKITSLVTDPKFAAVADEVPELKTRTDALVPTAEANDEAARLQGVTDKFQKIVDAGDPDKINKFMSTNADDLKAATDPANHDLLDQTQEAYRLQGVTDRFHDVFANGKPDQIHTFIEDNMGDLKAATDPANHDFLDQLHNTAGYFRSIPSGAPASADTLNQLANGNLASLVYGKALGRIPEILGGTVPGFLVDKGVEALSGIPHLAPIVGAVAGSLSGKGSHIDHLVSKVLFGGTQQDAMDLLNRASVDPVLTQDLMKMPSPEVSLREIMARRLEDAQKGAVYSSLRKTPAPPDETTPNPLEGGLTDPSTFDVPTDESLGVPVDSEQPPPEQHFAGGRVGRASGGKVDGDIEPLVNALMNKAKQAKTGHAKATEPLLNVHDNAIASALRVAQAAT